MHGSCIDPLRTGFFWVVKGEGRGSMVLGHLQWGPCAKAVASTRFAHDVLGGEGRGKGSTVVRNLQWGANVRGLCIDLLFTLLELSPQGAH